MRKHSPRMSSSIKNESRGEGWRQCRVLSRQTVCSTQKTTMRYQKYLFENRFQKSIFGRCSLTPALDTDASCCLPTPRGMPRHDVSCLGKRYVSKTKRRYQQYHLPKSSWSEPPISILMWNSDVMGMERRKNQRPWQLAVLWWILINRTVWCGAHRHELHSRGVLINDLVQINGMILKNLRWWSHLGLTPFSEIKMSFFVL